MYAFIAFGDVIIKTPYKKRITVPDILCRSENLRQRLCELTVFNNGIYDYFNTDILNFK